MLSSVQPMTWLFCLGLMEPHYAGNNFLHDESVFWWNNFSGLIHFEIWLDEEDAGDFLDFCFLCPRLRMLKCNELKVSEWNEHESLRCSMDFIGR